MSVTDDLWSCANGCSGDLSLALKSISNRIDKAVKNEYIELPKDADGVPVHVGDWIYWHVGHKAKVVAVTSDDVYWWEEDGCHWCHSVEVRHYHKPTVEDVLWEFANEVQTCFDTVDTIAEYAKKLREAIEHE